MLYETKFHKSLLFCGIIIILDSTVIMCLLEQQSTGTKPDL